MDLFKECKYMIQVLKKTNDKNLVNLLRDFKKKIKKYRKTKSVLINEYYHYKFCPWSDPKAIEGPDTCLCSYLRCDFDLIKIKIKENHPEMFKKCNICNEEYFI